MKQATLKSSNIRESYSYLNKETHRKRPTLSVMEPKKEMPLKRQQRKVNITQPHFWTLNKILRKIFLLTIATTKTQEHQSGYDNPIGVLIIIIVYHHSIQPIHGISYENGWYENNPSDQGTVFV